MRARTNGAIERGMGERRCDDVWCARLLEVPFGGRWLGFFGVCAAAAATIPNDDIPKIDILSKAFNRN